jgi:sporadic carbohydrate cluster 2OG-Fe(II) oxygenase
MKNFKLDNFALIKVDKPKNLLDIKKKFLKLCKKNGFSGEPNSFNKVSRNNLNLLMKNMNRDMNDMSLEILNSFYKNITKLCGKNIAFQRNPYLRVNCPHLNNTATIPHNDYDFGHSPFGFNIWLPLFDTEGKNGIYIISKKDSQKIYKNFKYNQRLDDHMKKLQDSFKFKKNFLKPKFLESLIFSNMNIHGAINDRFSKPRISLNLHYQPVNVPFGEKGAEFFNFGVFDEKNKKYRLVN